MEQLLVGKAASRNNLSMIIQNNNNGNGMLVDPTKSNYHQTGNPKVPRGNSTVNVAGPALEEGDSMRQ